MVNLPRRAWQTSAKRGAWKSSGLFIVVCLSTSPRFHGAWLSAIQTLVLQGTQLQTL
ncbi:uncharacterized protein BDV14DRAFT_168141 [Aspergillus stella-maris]|uniref:uncharacterized protein n=1 Tax=Aspergillus stella-maris TaxID=1810926 RepID=UPI003CCD13BA